MDRRRFLTGSASAVAVGVGIAGLGRRFDVRGSNSDDSEVSDRPSVVPTEDADEAEPEPETRSGALLSGMSFQDFSPTHFTAIEEWLGVKQAQAVIFVDMERSADEIAEVVHRLETIWQRGYVPHVFWQPNFQSDGGTDESVARQIHRGTYDDVLDLWASALSDWAVRPSRDPDRRIYLNFAPEFNGDWIPWGIPSPQTTTEDFVAMWHRVHDAVMNTSLQSDHVQWVWTANLTSSEPVELDSCYPGDAYTDWVGITGYNWENWGGWTPPEELYGGMVERVRAVAEKPISFAEFGASADCNGDRCPERKDEWIRAAYDYFAENGIRIAGYFDHNLEGETEWGVYDTSEGTGDFTFESETVNVYEGYRDAVRREDVLSAHPDAPRRLTDEEFKGTFPTG